MHRVPFPSLSCELGCSSDSFLHAASSPGPAPYLCFWTLRGILLRHHFSLVLLSIFSLGFIDTFPFSEPISTCFYPSWIFPQNMFASTVSHVRHGNSQVYYYQSSGVLDWVMALGRIRKFITVPFKTLVCFWRFLSLVLLMQVWHVIWTRHQVHHCSLCLTTLSWTKTALVLASNFPGRKKIASNNEHLYNLKQTDHLV